MNIIHQLKRRHVAQLHELFQAQWWEEGATLFDTQKTVNESSMVFGVLDDTQPKAKSALVGFARIITNFTTRAYILDVIVSPDHRGMGIGGYIIDAILTHDKLVNVPTFELQCAAEMKPYYERFGFYSVNTGRNSNIMYYDRVEDVVVQHEGMSPEAPPEQHNVIPDSANLESQEPDSLKAETIEIATQETAILVEAVVVTDSQPSTSVTVERDEPSDISSSQVSENTQKPAQKMLLSQVLIERLIANKRMQLANQTKLNQVAIDTYRERQYLRAQAARTQSEFTPASASLQQVLSGELTDSTLKSQSILPAQNDRTD